MGLHCRFLGLAVTFIFLYTLITEVKCDWDRRGRYPEVSSRRQQQYQKYLQQFRDSLRNRGAHPGRRIVYGDVKKGPVNVQGSVHDVLKVLTDRQTTTTSTTTPTTGSPPRTITRPSRIMSLEDLKLPKKNSVVKDKTGRFLSLFSVVRFANVACNASSSDNGTCYTASECTTMGGVSSGACAQGFGVCCLFLKMGGSTTSANCTYFVNNNYPAKYSSIGSSQLSIDKSSDSVCQLRLDFLDFVLSQPDSNGLCAQDQFIVTGSASPVPIICGTNSGSQMFVEAGRNTAAATLTVVTSGNATARSWKIKITQIPCEAVYRAPAGCLQYYTGAAGRIQSYNYIEAATTTSRQLASQDYSICVRVEAGFCGIRYTECISGQSFDIDLASTSNNAVVGSNTNQCQNDWVTIPCGTNQAGGTSAVLNAQGTAVQGQCADRFCGKRLNALNGQTVSAPVYSYSKPFVLSVHTNNNEANNEQSKGFCLDYVQQPCTATTG